MLVRTLCGFEVLLLPLFLVAAAAAAVVLVVQYGVEPLQILFVVMRPL